MSNDTTTTVAAAPQPQPEVDVKQPNWLQRKVVTPIKDHKALAIAAGAGLALVAVSAFAGRKSAQYDVVLELQPAEPVDVEPVTVIDTSSSDE